MTHPKEIALTAHLAIWGVGSPADPSHEIFCNSDGGPNQSSMLEIKVLHWNEEKERESKRTEGVRVYVVIYLIRYTI